MVTADCMRFLTCSAFGGMTMCSASSTALTEQSECMEVQTPHTRPTYAQTSRGSRSLTMISIPRIIVPVLKASVMTPFSISASMRRWPSILVIGSTTIRLVIIRIFIGYLYLFPVYELFGRVFFLPVRFDVLLRRILLYRYRRCPSDF